MTDLPDSLLRFDGLLERAVDRDLRSARPRRRRIAIRLAVATTAAAIAAGVVSWPRENAAIGPSGVATASAAERAAAALSPSGAPVLHHVASYRHVGPDGSVATWRVETWQQTVRPYTRREVTTRADGIRTETVTVGDRDAALYDHVTDTIYTNAPDEGPALGTPMPAADGDPLREQLLDLLRSEDARAVSRTTEAGRDLIRFTYENARPGGSPVRWTYAVDAKTYQPVRLTVASGEDSRVTTRFVTYEGLEENASSRALLSLQAQHPGAAVDRTEAGYRAARDRLYAQPNPD